MKKVTVFCGSSFGALTLYESQARQLGRYLALQNIGIVYGGANVGLMGALANGALEERGTVIGVLPKFLKSKEIAHAGLSELILVDTMHERKTRMNELSDGVIALPGGFGTLEEFFEMLTWGQLGLHKKPIGILNINGFYDPLIAMFESMVLNGFLKDANRNMVLVSDTIEGLLLLMRNYNPPEVGKWISRHAL
jgi:uncharacterized protein (TIGR00730 family)